MDIIKELEKLRREHYWNASDCWYSCPKSADGSCNDSEMDECTCGADRHNRQLDRIINYMRTNVPRTESQDPDPNIEPPAFDLVSTVF